MLTLRCSTGVVSRNNQVGTDVAVAYRTGLVQPKMNKEPIYALGSGGHNKYQLPYP